MRALGLDPSLSAYGWAIHDSSVSGKERRIVSGHEQTLPSTVPVARFMHFRTMVRNLLMEYDPDVVGIESPAYDAGPFQTIHYGLMMFSLEVVFERRKDCVLFDPATLKMLAKADPSVRKGTMTKLDMQRYVQLDTMDSAVIDNNEADAYCVGLFAARFMETVSGSVDLSSLTPSEQRVFLGRKRVVTTANGKKVRRIAHAFRENSRYFAFSKIPPGNVSLPKKSDIPSSLTDFLESLEGDGKSRV